MDSEGEDSDSSDNSNLVIRRARVKDSMAIYKLHLKSLGGVDRESSTWFEELLRLKSKKIKVLVAEVNGSIVGFTIAYRVRDKAYIDYLAVDPNLRGRGIGSKLLEVIEDLLAIDKVREVNLSVKEDNYKALQFYMKHGYLVKGVVLLLASPINTIPHSNTDGYTTSLITGSLRDIKHNVMPTTWWSSLTEYVDRQVYKKLRDVYTLLLYKGNRVKGLAEFSPKKRMIVDYIAVSYHKPAEALNILIEELKREAERRGVEEIIIQVDGSKGSIVRALLNINFRIKDLEFRLYKRLRE
ncbi:MAG: GNAT family N-acetyltransferase [Acidilobaceae archaeon]